QSPYRTDNDAAGQRHRAAQGLDDHLGADTARVAHRDGQVAKGTHGEDSVGFVGSGIARRNKVSSSPKLPDLMTSSRPEDPGSRARQTPCSSSPTISRCRTSQASHSARAVAPPVAITVRTSARRGNTARTKLVAIARRVAADPSPSTSGSVAKSRSGAEVAMVWSRIPSEGHQRRTGTP